MIIVHRRLMLHRLQFIDYKQLITTALFSIYYQAHIYLSIDFFSLFIFYDNFNCNIFLCTLCYYVETLRWMIKWKLRYTIYNLNYLRMMYRFSFVRGILKPLIVAKLKLNVKFRDLDVESVSRQRAKCILAVNAHFFSYVKVIDGICVFLGFNLKR